MPRVVLLLVLWLIGCTLPACTRGHSGLYGTVIPVTTIGESSKGHGTGILIGTASDRLSHLLITEHQNLGVLDTVLTPTGELRIAAQHARADLLLLKLHEPYTSEHALLPVNCMYGYEEGDRFLLEGYPSSQERAPGMRQRTTLAAMPTAFEGENTTTQYSFLFLIDPEPNAPPFEMSGGAYLVVRKSGPSEIIGCFQGQDAVGRADGRVRKVFTADRIGPWLADTIRQDR